jgi:hypothetical protein
MQRDQRYKTEQKYSDLVNAYSGVMNRVEGFDRKFEPATMHAVKPVVRKNENDEPDDQDRVVDHGRPNKEMQKFMMHV